MRSDISAEFMAVSVDLGDDDDDDDVVDSGVKAVELIVGARIRRVDVVLQLIKNLIMYHCDFDDEDLKG